MSPLIKYDCREHYRVCDTVLHIVAYHHTNRGEQFWGTVLGVTHNYVIVKWQNGAIARIRGKSLMVVKQSPAPVEANSLLSI
jgi:hypothetical protein